ncbi:unnamed protein product [Protopolystoma xenopodis]|uniref:Uncharacterized protein n=1 Tax=Protopolystoma xenopodis TaxID=117903 RepID=A0A448XPD8_9PLAT|nr:unnamed protein product [Protopolystoma xenopodis]
MWPLPRFGCLLTVRASSSPSPARRRPTSPPSSLLLAMASLLFASHVRLASHWPALLLQPPYHTCPTTLLHFCTSA